MDVLEPGRVPGHPAGGGAAVEDLRRLVEVDGDRDQLRLALDAVGATRRDEEVGQAVLAVLVNHHEPARAEAAQLALGDERGEDSADRGVDRVAALAQHLRAGLGGQRMPAATTPLALGMARSVSGAHPRTRPAGCPPAGSLPGTP